jgi:putative ABC transport system permease protein
MRAHPTRVVRESPQRLKVLAELYIYRVRGHPLQELMAGLGLAVGVALVFGVLLANASVTGSSAQLMHQIVGSARLVLQGRSSEGFDQGIVDSVRRLPGVKAAAPIMREPAIIVGPKRRQLIQLIGVTPTIVSLGSESTRNLADGAQLLSGGIGLPEALAHELGARSGDSVTVLARSGAHRVVVRATLGSQEIGAIASSPVVVGLLSAVQQVTGLEKHVTAVLVLPDPGKDYLVRRELERIASGRLEVASATNEVRLLEHAAEPNRQSTGLFAAIGAMVGFLLALNAMLITTPERRRFIAEMRSLGATRKYLLVVLASQAIFLGLLGSAVGIGVGAVLAHTLLHNTPGILTFAFLLGTHDSISATIVLAAVGCGVLAALCASIPSILDLRSPVADTVLHEPGEAGQGVPTRTAVRLTVAGTATILAVTVLVAQMPSLSVVGGVVLGAAGVMLIPGGFKVFLSILARVDENLPGSTIPIAHSELNATAMRSVALAGIAALAVYGSVAVGGARHDLLNGLDAAVTEYLDTADLWVSTDNNIFLTDEFAPGQTRSVLARVTGIASVRAYQGDMLTVGTRRLWIRARPPSDSRMIQASQLLQGDLVVATRRMRQKGWAVISNGFADEHRLRLGQTFVLPTPSGAAQLRVAAITTNVGWPPGAITLNTTDYRRYWHTVNPTALEVNLQPGLAPLAGKRRVEQALAGYPGLQVQTFGERTDVYREEAREGMRSLSQIATLLLIAAAVSVAVALSAAIWQRRAYLASLKAQGAVSWQVWRALLFECASVMGIGCGIGAVLGIYGHELADRWLSLTTGFPAAFSIAGVQVLISLATVVTIALVVVMLPGLSAARVSARESFQE